MLDAIVEAGTHWLSRGLPISELKIVVLPNDDSNELLELFRNFHPETDDPIDETFDVFLSYSSTDSSGASIAQTKLLTRTDVSKVFNFKNSIDAGASWQREIDKGIRSSRAMIALISPEYLSSPECQEELLVARLRNKIEGNFLLPIWWRGRVEHMDLWLRTLNLSDCRNEDNSKLAECVKNIRICT